MNTSDNAESFGNVGAPKSTGNQTLMQWRAGRWHFSGISPKYIKGTPR
jgi:hypothetical protein